MYGFSDRKSILHHVLRSRCVSVSLLRSTIAPEDRRDTGSVAICRDWTAAWQEIRVDTVPPTPPNPADTLPTTDCFP